MTSMQTTNCRDDSRSVPSQWEMALLCNNVSHWLGANLESALNCILSSGLTFHQSRPSNASHNNIMILVRQQLVITSSMERFPNVSQFSQLSVVCVMECLVFYIIVTLYEVTNAVFGLWELCMGLDIYGDTFIKIQQHFVLRSVINCAAYPRPRGLYYWSTMILSRGF